MATIQEKFEEFHKQNPKIYLLLKKFSKKIMERGYDTYSINAVFERIRWHVEVDTAGDSFKMNNNYRSRYARMLMEENPEFEGLYRTRQLTSR